MVVSNKVEKGRGKELNKKKIMKTFLKDTDQKVKEIYESFNGDLYFVTEKNADYNFGYVRRYNMPEFAEFGSFQKLEELKGAYGENKIWKVSEKNWKNINSYEDGLLRFEK